MISIQNLRLKSTVAMAVLTVLIPCIWACAILLQSSVPLLQGLGSLLMGGMVAQVFVVDSFLKILIEREYRISIVPRLCRYLEQCGLQAMDIDARVNASAKEHINRDAIDHVRGSAQNLIHQEYELRQIMLDHQISVSDESELGRLIEKARHLMDQLLY